LTAPATANAEAAAKAADVLISINPSGICTRQG
jgi:hypothetical protein